MLKIPRALAGWCALTPERAAWLDRLPATIQELQRRWALTIASPFDDPQEGSCAWVAPVLMAGGAPAVLKVKMPEADGAQEIDGLRFWDGDPTVRLVEADDALDAMLIERCDPGTSLRALAPSDQDVVIAGLLRRVWRSRGPVGRFRPLSEMLDAWSQETLGQAAHWPDRGLVAEGLRLFRELSLASCDDVLLATDLHAGNVLRARREPWLVIDPKPFVGDRAYDATQHLFNGLDRLRADPGGTIRRLADLLEVDPERARLWTFARAAAEPRDDWNDGFPELARAIGP